MDKKEGIKLVYKTDDCTMTWESPYMDEAIENIISGFYGLCVGQTWNSITILEAMKKFAEDHLEVEKDEDRFTEFSHEDDPYMAEVKGAI